jgi:hypothetical protein
MTTTRSSGPGSCRDAQLGDPVSQERLRLAADVLYREAVRCSALADGEVIGRQLADLGAAPAPDALLAWCRDFRLALRVDGPPVPNALVAALDYELRDDPRSALLMLVDGLLKLGHIERQDAARFDNTLGGNPSLDELRSALTMWIIRGAAWGGPILGWMRDLCHRLEDRGSP